MIDSTINLVAFATLRCIDETMNRIEHQLDRNGPNNYLAGHDRAKATVTLR